MAEVPDEAVELLAHDYYDRERYTYEKPWDELPDGERKSYRDDARTTLAAIAASGANRIVAGGVTVPDEAVEAFRTAFLAGADPDECLPRFSAIVAGLTAAAPLIAAQALTSTHDRIRAIAERLEAKGRAAGGDKLHLGTAAGVRLALVKLVEIADGLERGGDR